MRGSLKLDKNFKIQLNNGLERQSILNYYVVTVKLICTKYHLKYYKNTGTYKLERIVEILTTKTKKTFRVNQLFV